MNALNRATHLAAIELSSGPDPISVAPYRKLADRIGVGFIAEIDPDRLMLQDDHCLQLLRRPDPLARACLDSMYDPATVLVGPSRRAVDMLKELPWQRASVRSRFRVIPHLKLRASLLKRISGHLTRQAVHGLYDLSPQYSARIVVTTLQAIAATIVLVGLMSAAVFAPGELADGLRIVATVAFLSCTTLRIMAAIQYVEPTRGIGDPPDEPEPTYSVLVPLRHEAEIVPQLVTALGRLAWPRDRLEIKLICEADDTATIAAIKAHDLRDYIELIEVPPSLPRTKPKALRYALQVTTGEYVVLYDAEDIPHPMQLQQAWRRFASSGPELACLQAPLDISNGEASLISRMFAFEYAGLFRCLLPWLARNGSVLPLGGTSNHFRRSALEEVGAWDPHNVTEDADLGIRFARMGYRCGTITMPTAEEAPETFGVWWPQRTRWCKGWLQTWLVHMRQPAQLSRDLGLRSFMISQVLLFGIVVSSLVHPLLLYTIASTLLSLAVGAVLSTREIVLLGLDAFNIVCSYGAFIAIGVIGQKTSSRMSLWKTLAATPVYWLMLSIAAWRGLFEICWRPFHWHKTPHKPVRSLKRTPA